MTQTTVTSRGNRHPMAFVNTLSLALAALLLSACATYPKTFSNESPEGRFDRYRTYSFAENPGTDKTAGVRSLLTQYLMREIRSQMARRGYTETTESPDLTFNFELITKEKLRSTPSGSYGGYYGYGGYPYYGGYGAWGYSGDRITQYTEGSLYVTLIDNSTRNVVWEGVSVTRFDDDVLEDVDGNVRAAVQELFSQFPHYAPGTPRPAAATENTATS